MPDNSYRNILKGTAMFGGVQVFNILINLLRGKMVAILLGPEGMGISSLLAAASNTLQQFSSLGLNLSIVKEVASVKEQKKDDSLSATIHIARKLLRFTALLGAVATIFIAPCLSEWSFGTENYRWHFVCCSLVVFFTTMSNGELSILQGLHEVKNLALASIVGSLVGLLAGVPLYYFYGYDGIVPAMVLLAFATWLFYRFSFRRLRYTFHALPFTWREIKEPARRMLSLGCVLMVASLLGTLAGYLLNAFIGRYGTLHDVGLYQAANSMTNQYAGLVFTAMSLDFFPRLSAIACDNIKVRELVNRQSEIVVLTIAPVISLVILFSPLLIQILLTHKFLPLIPVIRLMALGLFFKAVSFPMGYISFAKGDKTFFFWFEGVWGNIMTLALNVLFYYYWGIVGIGISFVLSYFISTVLYIFLTRHRYEFTHTTTFQKLFFLLSLLVSSVFGASFLPTVWGKTIIQLTLCILCVAVCIYGLNEKLQIFKKISYDRK